MHQEPHKTHRHLTSDGSAKRCVFIVADDLTGACDSGAALLTAGRSVRVILSDSRAALTSALEEREYDVALAMEIRNEPLHEALAHLTEMEQILRAASISHTLFNKVDSAARGHFAVQTIAVLQASGAELALVAPAFPHAGRTVQDGVLQVCDAAKQSTQISLRELFTEIEPKKIEVLPAGTVAALEQGMESAISRGVQILLCDSMAQSDIERLTVAANRIPELLLWTGSAGLAGALAKCLPPMAPGDFCDSIRTAGRTLVLVGTDHPVTQLQLSNLRKHALTDDVVICDVDWDCASPQDIRNVFSAAATAALVLTGGDTAAFVLGALGAVGIRLKEELSPGIPWGVVEGGDADGCIVVTKSGGFGQSDALMTAVDFCRRTLRGTCAIA